jgi:hypothetical protein
VPMKLEAKEAAEIAEADVQRNCRRLADMSF